MNVYNDGSKLNDQTGTGIFNEDGRQELNSLSFCLSNLATVFQAEIFAINQAAIYVQSLDNYKFIKFFVDLQAALQALNKKDFSSWLVADTVHNLNLIPGQVRLVWIKAHVGHLGNKTADTLAKTGTILDVISPVALPKQVTKQAIRFSIDKMWNLEWTQYNDGQQSKQFWVAFSVVFMYGKCMNKDC